MPRVSTGMAAYFSPGHPAQFEKVTRAELNLIDSDHHYFFYSCNPDPATKVDVQGSLLASLTLYSQWKWLKERIEMFVSILDARAHFILIVPEQTKEGNIHFHAIVGPHHGFDENDIRRTFWTIMACNIASAKVRKHAVNIKPINDSGVVDYLFHKDAHDYEVIFNRQHKGEKAFSPLLLHSNTYQSVYHSSTDDSDSSSDNSYWNLTKEERLNNLRNFVTVKKKP